MLSYKIEKVKESCKACLPAWKEHYSGSKETWSVVDSVASSINERPVGGSFGLPGELLGPQTHSGFAHSVDSMSQLSNYQLFIV